MALLTQKVTVGNVQDAEAFVRHCIAKARGLVLTADQRDELIAEGLVILLELHRRYDPRKDKGAPAGGCTGFAGYALYLLPRKLADAWHRSQEHHLLRTQPDGSRRHVYLRTAKSLEEWRAGADDGDDRELHDRNCRTVGALVPVPLQDAA